MKTRTIRFRFFMWLAVHTIVIFFLIGLALVAFDLYEYFENPAMAGEEIEEIIVVASVMAVLLPVSLAGAWVISRHLLGPWKTMVVQAERISAGRLGERIQAVNPADEIGRLATTLNQTFDRYQNLLDRLQRFSYDASHQLRNPLAAIRTNGEVCLRQPRPEEEYRTVIGGMLEDADRLGRTVEQLLMLARAAGGALEESRVQIYLQNLAESVAAEGRMIGEMRGLSVEVIAPDSPLLLKGVPELIREAIANLLDNALRFSPDGGTIEIGLSQSGADVVRITVSDSGPGLSPAQKATVFRPFARDREAGKESVGLGLAIVADICEAHSARFGVEDRPVSGCCFWLEFPA